MNQDAPSPHQTMQAHSYLESDNDTCHHTEKNDDSIYATFAALANKKAKKAKYSTA
jgi:hypothetical protein